MYFTFGINYLRSVFIYPLFLHFLYRLALHPCCDAGECLSTQYQDSVTEQDTVRIMVPAVWSPNVAALLSGHKCALSQVYDHRDMALDVTKT